ncbi:MAG: permease, partial [Phycisphaerales bacterium]
MFSAIAVAIFIEAMPFLVIGALFSATIEVFVSTERLLRCIPKGLVRGLLLGIGAGFVLPTCECGVVPIVRRLMHKGVPPYVAIAYMLAAPIVNPVVLASTYLAFRGSLTMVLARVVLAAVVAAALGLYARWSPNVLLNGGGSGNGTQAHNHDHTGQSLIQKSRSVMIHAAQEFMDMGKFLIIGAMAAAAFKTLLPENIMSLFTG